MTAVMCRPRVERGQDDPDGYWGWWCEVHLYGCGWPTFAEAIDDATRHAAGRVGVAVR